MRILFYLSLQVLLSSISFTTISYALSANQIAQESYNVNHSIYVKNMMIKKKGRRSILSVSRVPGKKLRITATERYLSNAYEGDIESKDLIIIRSGKLNGLGVLMTSYIDPKRSHEYLMWIPALRKVRRMAEPKEAGLGAGDIAFLEDAKLRRFHEESYELLKTQKMNLPLKMMPFSKGELGRYSKYIPYKQKSIIRGRNIHVLKSTYKKKDHWYDYRISYIDSEYFTDYKTDYYKAGKKIKEVYRHWVHLGNEPDPKSKMWYYWYSKDIETDYEMMTYVPIKNIKINQKVKKSFWTTQTLEKIKR
ncbi:MAG: Unknown protein [uncultured Sulfurovum sp.]|uniref:Outer membrane lipoprotein-sorting protein n=1 Tax=uncultured Sulfurovum sp. TaxID=269237 RepID=A0A6S6SZM4_9BACT|nr:MAG: Unknown protein [uncultured Sulfurovum sp.]